MFNGLIRWFDRTIIYPYIENLYEKIWWVFYPVKHLLLYINASASRPYGFVLFDVLGMFVIIAENVFVFGFFVKLIMVIGRYRRNKSWIKEGKKHEH